MERSGLYLLAAAFLSIFPGQMSVAMDLTDSTTAESTFAENDVHNCALFKASMHTGQIRHEWVLENPDKFLNQSTDLLRRTDRKITLGALNVDNKYGGNWTMKLESDGLRAIRMEFNVTIPETYQGQPNNIFGGAVVQAENFTKYFRCYDAFKPLKYSPIWSGLCVARLYTNELAKVREHSSITVSMDITVCYANISQFKATGDGCDALKFFNKSEDKGLLNERPATSGTLQTTNLASKIAAGNYTKIWKKRVGLQWSIPELRQGSLQEHMEPRSMRKLSVLRVANETDGMNWFITLKVLQTLAGPEIAVEILPPYFSPKAKFLGMRGLQVAFTFGNQSYVKVVPQREDQARFFCDGKSNDGK